MTQKKLAEELTRLGKKTSNTAIANWESGLNSPDIDTLQLICTVLGKEGNYFFDNKKKSNAEFNIEGLNENDIQDVKKYVEFLKYKKREEK